MTNNTITTKIQSTNMKTGITTEITETKMPPRTHERELPPTEAQRLVAALSSPGYRTKQQVYWNAKYGEINVVVISVHYQPQVKFEATGVRDLNRLTRLFSTLPDAMSYLMMD